MKSFPAAFNATKNLKTGASPVWILKCPFPSTGTIYLSDLVFLVGSPWSITTKSWVKSWGAIDEDISGDMALTKVADFNLDVIIDPNTVPNIDTILWTAANNVEVTDCELYLWFRGLNPATDPPQKIWTGNIIDFEKVDELVYRLSLVDQSVRVDKEIGTKLDTTTYAKCDPADVGAIGSILYGTVANVPCRAIEAGGASSLTADITSVSPGNSGTLVLKDASRFPSGTAFILQVDDEQISIASRSGNTLTLAGSGARGYNGTTAAAHTEGAQAWEALAAFVYLIADHPVKTINDVYIDGVRLVSGITKYTGQTGNEHPSYAGKAIVTLQHGIGAVTRVKPNSATGTFTNPTKAIDGTIGNADADSAHQHYVGNYINVGFPAGSGSITTQTCRVWMKMPPDLYAVEAIGWSPSTIGSVGGFYWNGDGNAPGYMDFTKAGGGWADAIQFNISARVSSSEFEVYEMEFKEVNYYPYLHGDTAARIMIGDVITANVDGYQDDVGGTYTGTPSALIERPDHIFKHFLYTYAAWPTASFSTDAAASFAADTYKFGMVINEYKRLKEWLAAMAWQCRCYFRFSAGLAYLLYRPDTITSDKTILAGMTRTQGPPDFKTTLKISRSRLDQVINRINLHYNRDWTKTGDDAYQAISKTSDATSITRYGEKEQPDLFKFDFVTLSAMADDLRDFYLARYKDRKKVCELEAFLDNSELEFADGVTLAALANLLTELQKVNFAPGSGRDMRNDIITLVAREY